MVGVYCITNKINGKKYIGQSHNIEKRFSQHKYNSKNRHLKNAMKKYGTNNFIFTVIETFHPLVEQSVLDECESCYIIASNVMDRKIGYNIKHGGSRGRHTEESKKLLSISHLGKKLSENSRIKVSIALTGRPVSDKTKVKISISNTGKTRSSEWKKKQSLSHSGKPWSGKRRAAQYLRRIKNG